MSPNPNSRRVLSGFEKFVNQGDLSEVDAYIAPDYTGYFSGFPPIAGREAFRQFVEMQNNAFGDRSLSVEEVLNEGDKVALRVTFRGTHTGELNGIPPTGRTVEYQALHILHLSGDYCVAQWAVLDNMTMMQQLGLIPA